MSKIKKIKQTHGKEEKTSEVKYKPTTLDQVWGDDGTSKYNTMDEETYKDKLDGMNLSDLQAHATRIGLIPIDDRNMLISRLTREFKKHVAAYRTPVDSIKPYDAEIAKKVKRLLE